MSSYKAAVDEGRWARIYVPWDMFINDTDKVQQIMSKTVIARAEYDPVVNCHIYHACSPMFESIDVGDTPPSIQVFDPGFGELEFCAR